MGQVGRKKKVTGIQYSRKTQKRWTLNGSLKPNRQTLINHLIYEHCMDREIERLTYPELLALHDDDHNGGFYGFNCFEFSPI